MKDDKFTTLLEVVELLAVAMHDLEFSISMWCQKDVAYCENYKKEIAQEFKPHMKQIKLLLTHIRMNDTMADCHNKLRKLDL